MRIAIISERSLCTYLLEVFQRHPETDAQIVCFADWREPTEEAFRSIPVVAISALEARELDRILIAVRRAYRVEIIVARLQQLGLKKIDVIHQNSLETHRDFTADGDFDRTQVEAIPDGPYLSYIETHVCDHCNLSCMACGHFAPFVENRRTADIQQFEKDMNRLKDLFSAVGHINYLGGEPLPEPELCCRMICIGRALYPNSEIYITTNDPCLPEMSEQFWTCVREKQVLIKMG